MEKHLILDCLKWNLNITTPYHLSDTIQGMGCLFWSDFEPGVLDRIRNECQQVSPSDHAFDGKPNIQKLVLFLIQYRKFINYFIE